MDLTFEYLNTNSFIAVEYNDEIYRFMMKLGKVSGIYENLVTEKILVIQTEILPRKMMK